MKKIILYCWNNSVIRYIFWGGCTTLVNLGTYYLLRSVTSLGVTSSNVLSIITAILFAYVVNSKFVFQSEASTAKAKFSEFIKFVGARVSTMIIEVGGVFIMADLLAMNDYVAKFLIQFIVLVLNYVFSKFLVFSKKKSGRNG